MYVLAGKRRATGNTARSFDEPAKDHIDHLSQRATQSDQASSDYTRQLVLQVDHQQPVIC